MAVHGLLRHFGPALLREGYTIQPLTAGTSIRALIVRKDKHRWTLTDVGIMTGIPDIGDSTTSLTLAGAGSSKSEPLGQLYAAVDALQSFLATRFHASLSSTLPSASLRASRHFLPSDGWLWPPSRLLDVMCRQGGAYRGGVMWAKLHVGEAWAIDLNRAYTWALTQPLPIRWGIGTPYEHGTEREGIYLCELRGHPTYPVYCSLWRGPKAGFRNGYFRGGKALVVSPSGELPGPPSLGLSVRPPA